MRKRRVVLFDTVVFAAYVTTCLCGTDAVHAQARRPIEAPVQFADAALSAAVQKALGIAAPTPTDMLSLYDLHAQKKGIQNLAGLGLEYATNLRVLDLEFNKVADVSVLAALKSLINIDLSNNQLRDVSALAGLVNLTTLWLDNNQIGDISPLAGLRGLTFLWLSNNRITDLSSLAGLTNLDTLWLYYNQIRDISPIAGLAKLKDLNLIANEIVDLRPLRGLTQLTRLTLQDNHIRDVSILKGLANLTDLGLGKNQIQDISALSGLTRMTHLDLDENQISSVSAIAGMTHLVQLYLSVNQITDISPLAGLTEVKELFVFRNQIADISALGKLANLTDLWLASNCITGLSALKGLIHLQTLHLENNRVVEVSPLKGLTNLTSLVLSQNKIVDVAALAKMTALTELWLSDNRITSIVPLAGLASIRTLWLSNNQINDVSALAGLSTLSDLQLDGNQLANIGALAGLVNLTKVQLDRNRIREINALAGLVNLTVLGLSHNQIVDISALASMRGLTSLDLSYNGVESLDALSGCRDLVDLNVENNPLPDHAYCVDIPAIRANNPNVRISSNPAPSGLNCRPANTGRVFFVDDDASLGGDGSSWNRAFNCLQDALTAAKWGDEIRVAQGTYRPDRGAATRPGDPNAAFQLKNGVTLHGGYAGRGFHDPNLCDVVEFQTVLSGDLAGNDRGQWNDPSRGENSFHVVVADYADSTAVLDGFTIRGGNDTYVRHANTRNPWDWSGQGGGVRAINGRPTIRNCVLIENSADLGGGIGIARQWGWTDGYASVCNCQFANNYATYKGGALYSDIAYPYSTNVDVRNCAFVHNSARWQGAGIYGIAVSLTDCTFEDQLIGEAIYASGYRYEYSYGDRPFHFFNNVTVGQSGADGAELCAGVADDTSVWLQGDLTITKGELSVRHSLFDGLGKINLSKEASFRIASGTYPQATVVRAKIGGSGTINVDAGQQLILEGNAVVSLSSSPGGLPDPDRDGHVLVNGSLVVRGNATVESTNIDVKLLEIQDPNVIQYNNITLLEASTGFGGEFFVGENARIKNNSIVSEGDRYLDLDPKPNDSKHPTIQNNRITVVIKEGTLGSQGTLLELRAKDYDAGTALNPVGSSGAYQVPGTSAGFTKDPCANWVLEKLILEPNSKLNLTNRQGFEFQSPNERYPETLYVKELVLGPNAVLNTALQTMYYQRLVDPNGVTLARNPTDPHAPLANGARFEDIPLLGFSLGIIAMNDPMEFAVRVRQRLTDPADASKQPPTPAEPLYIGSITRIDASLNPAVPVANRGVMEMCTQAPDKQFARSVAAKGAFARAGEEQITVEFEYMFREHPDPSTELIVYLSDNAEVSQGTLLRVATIRPPDPGRPGSAQSGRFAVFSGMFSRANLDFHRGTYVELELRGQAACCWIDNWDPKIECGAPKCGDYNNDGWINMTDFLMLLAEMGPANPSRPDRRCLDLVGDGCVGVDDLLLWDSSVFNICPGKAVSTISMAAVSALQPPFLTAASTGGAPSVPLVIFGKSGDRTGYRTALKSQLYRLSSQGLCLGSDLAVGNGRLFTDSYGTIYQIQNGRGIIRTDTGQTVVPERQNIQHISSGSLVSIGSIPPLLDAAFDPTDAKTAYVVPVQVKGPGGTVPYLAAAKLRWGDASPNAYSVEALYGLDPSQDPNQKNDPNGTYCQDPTRFDYEPDMQHLREIEVDRAGRVYVLSSLIRESQNATSKHNWILIYDRDAPSRWQSVYLNDLDLAGPVAMLVSKAGDRLYLTSTGAATDADPNGLTTRVFCFSLKTRADGRLDVALDRTWTIVGLEAETASLRGSHLIEPDRFVCMVTSMTEDPVTGTLYAAGFTTPKFTDQLWQEGTLIGFFTQPLLAEIPQGAQGTIRAKMIDDPNPDHPLLLPLSVVGSAGGAHMDALR